MVYGLTRRATRVDTQVVTVRLELAIELEADRVEQAEQLASLISSKREHIHFVAAGNDQRVSFANRKGVSEGTGQIGRFRQVVLTPAARRKGIPIATSDHRVQPPAHRGLLEPNISQSSAKSRVVLR